MSNMLFPMKADIYYASESQNEIGQLEKDWVFGRTVDCELKAATVNTELRFAMNNYDEFFSLPQIIFGRFQEDIREHGNAAYPLTQIVVTNIRGGDCAEIIVFEEAIGGEMVPMVFEFKSFAPFINPWGRVEYFKTQLMRSDDQEVIDAGS